MTNTDQLIQGSFLVSHMFVYIYRKARDIFIPHCTQNDLKLPYGLKIHTENPPSGQISHAFSGQWDFILLVRTVAFYQKIFFNNSYIEKKNNYFCCTNLYKIYRILCSPSDPPPPSPPPISISEYRLNFIVTQYMNACDVFIPHCIRRLLPAYSTW